MNEQLEMKRGTKFSFATTCSRKASVFLALLSSRSPTHHNQQPSNPPIKYTSISNCILIPPSYIHVSRISNGSTSPVSFQNLHPLLPPPRLAALSLPPCDQSLLSLINEIA